MYREFIPYPLSYDFHMRALLLSSIAVTLGFDCTSQSSCDSCYSSSFLCHWCKDVPDETSGQPGSCHTKFSKFGCQVGDSCNDDDCAGRDTCSSCAMGGCKWCASAGKCVSPYSWACALPSNCIPNEECKRPEPEFVGYRNDLPNWAKYTMIAGYIALCIFTIIGLYLCYPGNRVVTREQNEEEQTTLVADPPGRKKSWLFKLFAAASVVTLVAIGVTLSMIGLYWPSIPEVDMCNAELMWSNTMDMIIKTITTGKANVESELLITVYNPNRFGGTLNALNGNVYYKTVPVGNIELGYIDVVPGSASDGLGVMTFHGFDKIYEMYYDFNVKHDLQLQFELFTSFTIGGHNISTVIPKFQMNINKPPPQKYCKCKERVSNFEDDYYTELVDFEIM
jgi:hypothetical protein